MTKPRFSDGEIAEMIEKFGPAEAARKTEMGVRAIYKRRVDIEQKTGRQITAPKETGGGVRTRFHIEHPERYHLPLQNGIVLIGSDQHYWPGVITTAHRGFVKFVKDMQPNAVILNGDVFDGAKVSRHASIGWENKPSVIEEIETCQERLAEIQDAAPPKAKRSWCLGNHDGRFEARLANVAPEYARVHGVHLKDHFPFWEPCWATWINTENGIPDTVVKHRFRGGEHAAHNNTIRAGTSFVTGHDHTGKVTPFTDYRGTRWGVSLPTMAEPFGPQFVDYTEDNPRNHRSGFAVLTYHKGRLLCPEIAFVYGEDKIEFRGQVIHV